MARGVPLFENSLREECRAALMRVGSNSAARAASRPSVYRHARPRLLIKAKTARTLPLFAVVV